MAKLSISLLLLVGVCSGFSSAQNYCRIDSCNGRRHTACTYHSYYPAPKCGRYQQVGLSAEEKRRALDKHNELRQRVARGQERLGNPGPQPAARYMPILKWDDELADIAQKWASQCTFAHDSCRNVRRFSVGQNIAYRGTTGDLSSIKVEDLVKDWYDEVKDYNRKHVSKFTTGNADNGKQIGHYTQLVWAKTSKIGCGAMKYKEGRFNKFFLVCNYGQAGNYIGEPVYEKY